MMVRHGVELIEPSVHQGPFYAIISRCAICAVCSGCLLDAECLAPVSQDSVAAVVLECNQPAVPS